MKAMVPLSLLVGLSGLFMGYCLAYVHTTLTKRALLRRRDMRKVSDRGRSPQITSSRAFEGEGFTKP